MSATPVFRSSTFQALFDTAPDAMIVTDLQGLIVLTNPQAEQLFGYSSGAMRGLRIEMLVPQRARDGHEAHRVRYVNQPRVRPMGKGQELTGLRSDGSEFPVEIGLSPIESEDGRFFVASIRDISETQRARQALARARYDTTVAQLGRLALETQGYDAMLETLPGMVARELEIETVAVVFTQGRVNQLRASTGMSSRMQEIFSTLLSPHMFAAVLRTDSTYISAAIDSNDAGFAPVNQMLQEMEQGGLIAVPLFDRGRPMGALFAATRRTEGFDRDKVHFLQSVANLLAAAVQRSRSEEQLAHAQRLDAVGQLTGGIAHDFNNLLTVISGNLQLLEDEFADKPDPREIVDGALRAVTRGAELTRKLLVFARRQRLKPETIDPRALLDELGPMLTRTLGETVKVEVEYAPNLSNVFVDPAELDAAILNLAINARDAMPRGGTLLIAARAKRIDIVDSSDELPAGNYVVIEVRDTGLGMLPEVLARAFEPFFTTKDAGRGSGLGLSMVYGFVKQSGGHLTADSRLGYGTRIDLYLPAIEAAAAKEPKRKALPEKKGAMETILVVEDEPAVRTIAVRFLRSLGYATYECGDAETALALLESHPDIALLFSDVILGSGMNGGELAIAARLLLPNLRVLLTSGYEHPVSHVDIALPSSIALLDKPYRREELAAAIEQAMAKNG